MMSARCLSLAWRRSVAFSSWMNQDPLLVFRMAAVPSNKWDRLTNALTFERRKATDHVRALGQFDPGPAHVPSRSGVSVPLSFPPRIPLFTARRAGPHRPVDLLHATDVVCLQELDEQLVHHQLFAQDQRASPQRAAVPLQHATLQHRAPAAWHRTDTGTSITMRRKQVDNIPSSFDQPTSAGSQGSKQSDYNIRFQSGGETTMRVSESRRIDGMKPPDRVHPPVRGISLTCVTLMGLMRLADSRTEGGKGSLNE
ncbi:hypothetical protein EYF80_008794 [Liparis tanakae]|uniref:Uncharacterized protein n=1 Tax=Liparis tanakae TaxID=230148 RepID=A0A4Z2IU79_9TELE|nr:hypothetical protein EYF80_008794 [Liparis tanakae]